MEREELGVKPITNHCGLWKSWFSMEQATLQFLPIQSFHQSKTKSKLFFFDWFHWFLEEKLMDEWKEDIITVIRLIWPWSEEKTKFQFGFWWMKGQINLCRKPSATHKLISFISLRMEWMNQLWMLRLMRPHAELPSFLSLNSIQLKRKWSEVKAGGALQWNESGPLFDEWEEIGFVFLSFGGLVAAAPHGSAKGKRTKTKTNQSHESTKKESEVHFFFLERQFMNVMNEWSGEEENERNAAPSGSAASQRQLQSISLCEGDWWNWRR